MIIGCWRKSFRGTKNEEETSRMLNRVVSQTVSPRQASCPRQTGILSSVDRLTVLGRQSLLLGRIDIATWAHRFLTLGANFFKLRDRVVKPLPKASTNIVQTIKTTTI